VFRGDGHIAFPKNTNSVVYDFGSISYPLVQKMILLFHSLGIVPSYKRSRSEKSSDFAHFFRISTKKQIEQLRDFKDSFTQKKVDEQLKNCKDIKPCGFEKGNGQFCIVNIKAISKKTEERDVYS
ncbi:nucleotide sugar dehydrogenase, partial [bacterium (Candidatus Gribaldobacteria) CG10_big_fil_rev_8_21_14_0_10_41_12]